VADKREQQRLFHAWSLAARFFCVGHNALDFSIALIHRFGTLLDGQRVSVCLCVSVLCKTLRARAVPLREGSCKGL